MITGDSPDFFGKPVTEPQENTHVIEPHKDLFDQGVGFGAATTDGSGGGS